MLFKILEREKKKGGWPRGVGGGLCNMSRGKKNEAVAGNEMHTCDFYHYPRSPVDLKCFASLVFYNRLFKVKRKNIYTFLCVSLRARNF